MTMSNPTHLSLPTLELTGDICAGARPHGWIPLDQMPLLILVGVTGVGKSTTLARMHEQGARLYALPERRALTDLLIIPAVQNAEGAPRAPVTDRSERFGYTRRFRTYYPGGMAQALQLICVAPSLAGRPLLFDGLRGEEEVRHALETLPAARFVMLDAPDLVRVLRLVARRDVFDAATAPAPAAATTLGDLLQDEVGALFDADEVSQLQRMIAEGAVSAEEVRAKARIVSEERRNYDPAAARQLLLRAGNDRALVVDTTAHDSTAVASLILAACQRWFAE